MESLHKLENMVEGWLKPVPHLPETWRKWLANNAWWLTLIGVILSILGIFGLFAALSLFTATTSIYGAYAPAVVAAATNNGLTTTAIWISLALLVVTTIVEAVAISPLKKMSKKGWDYMFLALIIGVVSNLVGAVLRVEILSVFTAIISAAIGAYVLFEVRSHFKKA